MYTTFSDRDHVPCYQNTITRVKVLFMSQAMHSCNPESVLPALRQTVVTHNFRHQCVASSDCKTGGLTNQNKLTNSVENKLRGLRKVVFILRLSPIQLSFNYLLKSITYFICIFVALTLEMKTMSLFKEIHYLND